MTRSWRSASMQAMAQVLAATGAPEEGVWSHARQTLPVPRRLQQPWQRQ